MAVSRTNPGVALSIVSAEPIAPTPSPKPGSYEVRIRAGVGNAWYVVGHDRNGDPMIEARMKRKHVTARTIRNMARWCKENDEPGPDLSIIPPSHRG
jgi:hypothetical protein